MNESKIIPFFLFVILLTNSCSSDDNEKDDEIQNEMAENCIENPRPIILGELVGLLSDDFNTEQNEFILDLSFVSFESDLHNFSISETPKTELQDTNKYTFYWPSDTIVERYYSDNSVIKTPYKEPFKPSVDILIGPIFENDPTQMFDSVFRPIPMENGMNNTELMEQFPEKAEISGEMNILYYIKSYELTNIGDMAAWFYGTDNLIVLNGNQVIQISADISISGSILENYSYSLKIYDFLKNCGENPN